MRSDVLWLLPRAIVKNVTQGDDEIAHHQQDARFHIDVLEDAAFNAALHDFAQAAVDRCIGQCGAGIQSPQRAGAIAVFHGKAYEDAQRPGNIHGRVVNAGICLIDELFDIAAHAGGDFAGEYTLVGEVVVEAALGDCCGIDDLVDADAIDVPLGEQALSCAQEGVPGTVSPGVGTNSCGSSGFIGTHRANIDILD